MCATLVCIAAMTLGVDPGWQRLDDGGWRYLIQIDPGTLEDLRTGQLDRIESDIPRQLDDIRCYRITVGRGQLPQDELPKLPPPHKPRPSEPGPSASVRPTSLDEHVASRPELDPQPASVGQTDPPPKPWLPLTLALSAALGCFGGMLYLGWIAWDYRKRYQKLFHQMIDAQASAIGQPG